MKNDMIYPELGQKTEATIEYSVSYSGKFYITTDIQLKGRGIKQVGDGSDHKRGKKTFLATEKAMDVIKGKYDTCYIASL